MRKVRNTILLIIILIANIFILIDYKVINSTRKDIKYPDKVVDAILILGAGIKDDKPSLMLEERLDKGLELYNNNVSSKIIVSGDHGRTSHDEVNVMKNYLIDKGVPSENIFMDHAGFSTYESIYRAKAIFEVKTVAIVTEKYHLYRALYLAKEFNLQAFGIDATKIRYFGQTKRDIRENIARVKDYFYAIFKPDPTYLGEIIPITGNGNITNDKDDYYE